MFGLHVLQTQSLSSKTLKWNTAKYTKDSWKERGWGRWRITRCWKSTDERQAGLYAKKPLRSGEKIKDICMLQKLLTYKFQCLYWNWGHPDSENQSEGRTETIDSNIFKSSQSNAQYKPMKSQLVCWPVMFTRLWCRLNVKLKPVVLSCAYGFRYNYMLHTVYLLP